MTCKTQKSKKNFYIHEKDEIESLNIDQTVIVKEDFLKHLTPFKKLKEEIDFGVEFLTDGWYPYVNSYYPYTEDVDAFARVSHLLGSKPSFASLSSSERDEPAGDIIPYSEHAAQLQYLESNPFSFIILGKPGIGEQELGKRLADYWKCIYIDPEILIQQEIYSGSRAGQCIQFNLNCGRAIGIDVILRLVEKRVKSESAKHRGFVICGLPLIPNDLYKEDPISSESAVFTAKEIFEEMIETTVEVALPLPKKPRVSISSKFKSDDEKLEQEEEDDEEETSEEKDFDEETSEETTPRRPIRVKPPPIKIPVDVGPDYDLCQAPEIGTNYEDQLNLIFDLMKPPFMIIYIMCSTADVIEKRKNYRFDVDSKQTINLQTEMHNKILFKYFSEQEGLNDEIPEDFLETEYMNIDSSQLNHLIKLPRHFPANVSTQLDSYHYTGLKFIERRVLMHDPQYFLKVDGRVSVQRMLYIIKSRLNVLPIQKVVIPTRLDAEPLDEGEDGADKGKPQGRSLEKWFIELSRRQVPSNTFKWTWSDWGAKCPVALREGILKVGDPNFAVHFMNRLFFLSSEDNFFKFYKNPRPYLLPPQPKSPGKIFVFGPKFSGKTAVSNCLGYLLNGTVLSIADMLADFLMHQEEELKEKIRQAAIAEAMKLLNEQRLEESIRLEAERIENIKEWLRTVKKLIEDIITTLVEMENTQTVSSAQISSFPMPMKKVSLIETENPLAIEILGLKDQINKLHIPFSYKTEEWQGLLLDKRKLLTYLPTPLRAKVKPKPATIFDIFVIEYAANAVNSADIHDTTLTDKNLVDIFTNNIRIVEEEQGNRGGWILDGMICETYVINEMYPDFIADEMIVLLDEEEPDFLVNRYNMPETNEFINYREFFLSIGKLDAAWRSPSKVIEKTISGSKIVREILSDVLNDTDAFDYGDSGALEKGKIYRRDILAFYQKWDEMKKYFLERGISPIEIKVGRHKSIADLMKELIMKVEDKYRMKASLFTELDRAEEVKNFGSQMLQDISEDAHVAGDEAFEQNRRYGDTYHFCPVTFHDKYVLWPGKEDFSVKFENKLYLLSSEEDMNKFLQVPRNYLTGRPPEAIPPPRICVIGIPGTRKTAIAKALASNYGLVYISFESLLKKHFKVKSDESINQIRLNQEIDPVLSAYLNLDNPLSEDIFNEGGLSKYWFTQPLSGFVIDDFPKRPSDVKFMTKYKLIPDVIINLTNKDTIIKTKLVHNFVERWQHEMMEQRVKIEEQNNVVRLEWEAHRKKRFDELMEEKRERRYAQKRKEKETPEEAPKDRPYMDDLKEVDEETDRSGFITGSQVSFDSVAEQDDMNEVNQELDKELPQPVFDDSLETIDEAMDKFEAVALNAVTIEGGFLKNVRGLCASEIIPFSDVITHFDNPELTKRSAFIIADKIKFRTRSLFERCYDVSMEVADRLLSCGYFFLSKFGKTCPVQYYEDQNPIQMYVPLEQKYNLFPVIHRSYIYYLGGEENQSKFKTDPLKYTLIDSFNFPLITLKAAVSGPPKCGKTVLATRIADEYNFKCITRGQAARYVLTCLPLSDLAKNMESVLRRGWELTDEMIVKCVEAACFDSKAVTQGIVLDGFPNTITEVRHLSYVAMVPNLNIDLQATPSEVLECLSFDTKKRDFPKFSERFIKLLLKQWGENAEIYRQWFDREYQVTTKIPITTSNWSVWTQSKAYITTAFFEIKHYFIHASYDWPLRLAYMQITPLELLERQGPYKIYCPCCLHFFNVLNTSGDPPDRTGLVQFRFFFYWLCADHIEQFLKTPSAFLPPYNNHKLPSELPHILKLTTLPDNVFEDGACVLCYKKKGVIVKGNVEFAVEYNRTTYLFDKRQCLHNFMHSPYKFICEISFKPPDNYPPLNYNELPILGMLEQYVAKYIIKALSFVARHRPIIPGLSVHASAVVGVGLHLKIFNPKIPEEYRPFYKEAEELYEKRRTKLTNYLAKMKSVINPYLHYDEPLPDFQMPLSVRSETTESVGTTMTKIVNEIIDNIDYTP